MKDPIRKAVVVFDILARIGRFLKGDMMDNTYASMDIRVIIGVATRKKDCDKRWVEVSVEF